MEDEVPVKRGRGRPKGSLNKKTLARVAEEEADVPVPFTLDVDFESNEILGESEPIPEPAEPEEPASPPPPPKLKRRVSRKAPPAPPVSEESEDEPPPPPKRKRAVRMQAQPRREPVPAAAPQPPPVVQPPPTYLEVLTRGLRAAQATQKAEKVARYDAFFAR